MSLKTSVRYVLITCILLGGGIATAAEVELRQKNKAFSKTEITIKAGDTVKFPNDDPFFHNIFSLSETQMFDLGSYPQGESREVTFSTPGVVEVECAIHPQMRANIVIE